MSLGLLLGLVTQNFFNLSDGLIYELFFDGLIDVGGQVFIISLKMIVVPLVFVSLTCGAASLGSSGSIGRLGGKTIGLYLITTAIAVSMALLVALFINPGLGAVSEINEISNYSPKSPPSFKETFINIFPNNPIEAMAEGKMLQVIVFALLFGIAISKSGEAGEKILSSFEQINFILMKLIMLIVSLAPYGVFCLMVKLGLTIGIDEIAKLAQAILQCD